MPAPLKCDVCGRDIPANAHYVVRIDVFADPSMPPIDSEALKGQDFDAALDELLEEMKDLSADELQDQVHRQFEYRLCRPCQMRYLVNPLGLPRDRRPAPN